MSADFLGAGWAYPLSVDGSGRISVSSYETNIRESIMIILGTVKGERQMRPDFGCGIHELVFAKNNSATAGMARYHVEQALVRWEPRIELISIDARPELELQGTVQVAGAKLMIEIEYRVIATNSIFNLVYPFYLTEGVGA